MGLNVYREQPTRLQFENLDDYKNWQMANLNTLIFTDEVIDASLAGLQSLDPYWHNLSRPELRAMLHAYWRNAGKWHLAAENNDTHRAVQAVSVWQQVVIERVHTALQEAQTMILLDRQMQALATQQTLDSAKLAGLQQTLASLQSQRASLASVPPSQVLDQTQRWSIWQNLDQAELGTTWPELAERFPASEEHVEKYLPWMEQANLLLDTEIIDLNSQIEALQEKQLTLSSEYEHSLQINLGLSADLQVEGVTADPPQVTVVRPTGLLMLIGGLFGLAIWLAQWAVRISLLARA
ncbi:MAG: hypothetical protein AB1894_16790 [Chloroflexota bacterium]